MTLIHALFWFTGLVIWAILWMIFVAWIAVGLPEIIRERMEHRRLRKDGRIQDAARRSSVDLHR